MIQEEKYTIGLDFGTDSSRAALVRLSDGCIIRSASAEYPRWKSGFACCPSENRYRQHPLDYLESLQECVREVLAAEPEAAGAVVGISVDSTASTPVLTDSNGTPLAMLDAFSDNPDAMFVLWKDHSSVVEADEINALCSGWDVDYRKYCGGNYSSEWVWAKMLHCLRNDPSLSSVAGSWVEECDWIAGILAGRTEPATMARCRCTAGHKAMWSAEWGGLPSWDFLHDLDPVLDVFKGGLYAETVEAGTRVGGLCPEWAERLGLPEGIAVAAGAADCHSGAVGAGIAPGISVKVVGTSTCDLCVAPKEVAADRVVRGICGQVDGSIVPGLVGYEAGQASFGDVYAWAARITGQSIPVLTEQACALPLSADDIVALDWFNGRRSPDENARVRARIDGLSLATTPAHLFKALVEATCFGSRAIYERYIEDGVIIDKILAVGGIARKSGYVMQTMADVIGVEVNVADADEACALGAAMFAAVAAGEYPTVEAAQAAMRPGVCRTFAPDPDRHAVYDLLYKRYLSL